MRGGSGSWRGGDASSGACHVAYRLRAGDSGRRAGGRAGGGQGPAGLHRLDAAQAGPSGVRGGRPARARLPDPPALFRPHLDPAGHHRPGGQGASPRPRLPPPPPWQRPPGERLVSRNCDWLCSLPGRGGRLQSYKLLEGRACGTK